MGVRIIGAAEDHVVAAVGQAHVEGLLFGVDGPRPEELSAFHVRQVDDQAVSPGAAQEQHLIER